MHTGRHRMKTHAGIPHGSTCNLGNALQLYYQFNSRETGIQWFDKSVNANHAAQSTSANRPIGVAGGGLDFEDTNNASTASMMDFTSFNIGVEVNFLTFIVWNPETTSNSAYLSDSTSEVFQQTNGNTTLFKTSGATNSMTHSDTFVIDTGEKSLLMIHRTEAGTVKLYKNGLIHDPEVTDSSAFDLQNLGSKNDASNWFDGIIYDVGIVSGQAATDKIRDMITDYLCSKHGLKRLG